MNRRRKSERVRVREIEARERESMGFGEEDGMRDMEIMIEI